MPRNAMLHFCIVDGTFLYLCRNQDGMTIAAIKKELHQMIDMADNRQLKALHTLLGHNDAVAARYSAAELEKFYGILRDCQNGSMATFDADDALTEIRAKIVAGR